MKTKSIFIITIVLMCYFTIIPLAGQWTKDNIGWKYINDDGSSSANSWHQDPDGKWYYFGSDGYMLHDQWIDGKYYLSSSGAMLVNTTTPDGYTVGTDGTIVSEVNQETIYENYYETTYDNCTYKVYYNNVYLIPESNSTLTISGFDVNKEGELYVKYSLISDKKSIKLPIKIRRGFYESRPNHIISYDNIDYRYEDKNSFIFSKKDTSKALPYPPLFNVAEYILYLG